MSRWRRGLGQGRGRREGVCPGEVGGEVCMGREIVSPWRDTSETHRRHIGDTSENHKQP